MSKDLDLDDVAAGNPLALQELEALRKDAERYRWLRARPLDDDEIFISVDSDKFPNRWGLGGTDPGGCDAAIDAAMAAEAKEKQSR